MLQGKILSGPLGQRMPGGQKNTRVFPICKTCEPSGSIVLLFILFVIVVRKDKIYMGHRGSVGSRFEQIALSATLQAQSARPESIRACCNLLSSFLFLSIFESVWCFLFLFIFAAANLRFANLTLEYWHGETNHKKSDRR